MAWYQQLTLSTLSLACKIFVYPSEDQAKSMRTKDKDNLMRNLLTDPNHPCHQAKSSVQNQPSQDLRLPTTTYYYILPMPITSATPHHMPRMIRPSLQPQT